MKNATSYRLLGIDPGTTVLGYALLEVRGKQLSVPEMGTLVLHKFPDHEERLHRIFQRVTQLSKQYHPQVLAIEAPFYGKNPQSMLKLGRAQGVAMAAAMAQGLSVTEYAPRKIKQAITGNGNASKEQVAALLEQQVSVNLAEQLLDATDALACALCCYYDRSLPVSSGHPKGTRRKGSNWSDFLKNNPDRVK